MTGGISSRERALGVLNSVFGYPAFRGQQADIVDRLAGGGDALVLMPTGGGKSLCYQIPALLRPGVGVVVSPLIALMQDQVDALGELGVRAAFLNSTLTGREAAAIEHRVRDGELDLLYVAPERLLSARCLELLSHSRIALFAIDEAHCVSQWGHDFRPEYLQLSVLGERFAGVPRIALTATADTHTRVEILERLRMPGAEVFVSSFDRPNIRYRIVEKQSPRRQLLDFIRGEHDGEAGIVYCLSRRKVEEVAAGLVEDGIRALAYHAGLDSDTRRDAQARFLREDGLVMVATIAFGMGIDKPDVRFVAHLDLPRSVEGYYQETGRAGRDGAPADAWMAYGLQDVVQQRRFIQMSDADDTYKRVAGAKLDAMLGLCETSSCRRVLLLGYFGEPSAPCGNCDTCLDPPAVFDATVEVQKLLSCVYRAGQRFGAVHIVAILRGEATAKVRQWKHDQLSTFGVGGDRGEQEWRAIVRQCIALGLLEIDHGAFGALKLTQISRAVLKGERRIELRTLAGEPRRKAPRARAQGALSGAATAVFDRLREWRAETARTRGVPAYVILHDSTLQDIARIAPENSTQLGAIAGIGAKKLQTYGADILALLGRLRGEQA
ncbi:MAG: DNA helicase RecQ [Gammaproteobacteria bacterium]